jgi:hypothetical protein
LAIRNTLLTTKPLEHVIASEGEAIHQSNVIMQTNRIIKKELADGSVVFLLPHLSNVLPVYVAFMSITALIALNTLSNLLSSDIGNVNVVVHLFFELIIIERFVHHGIVKSEGDIHMSFSKDYFKVEKVTMSRYFFSDVFSTDKISRFEVNPPAGFDSDFSSLRHNWKYIIGIRGGFHFRDTMSDQVLLASKRKLHYLISDIPQYTLEENEWLATELNECLSKFRKAEQSKENE